MAFDDELEFEKAVVSELQKHGWKHGVLNHPTEKDLLKNWANILFENNRQIDRLNEYPLTDTEMQQIVEQITKLRTPLKLNGFINGRTVSIKRDNPNDKAHFGKEVSLKIYDRNEIAGGDSRYQIAEQPIFNTKSPILNNRRGDLILLINGMPVFHIELKKSNIPISQASTQIEKYAHEGIFNGIYSLVQIFVAMNPEETIYFATPGPDGKFNSDFYFHWEDFNNEPINDWKKVISSLLSIPMAHQLIGFYTVADDTDNCLKVMRSYQYYAANAISDKVSTIKDWNDPNTRGGYIWHTTGSGKTMTSFKSAQLIANSKDADKVIFLIDRIELGIQSLRDYNGFADEDEIVQSTEDTEELKVKLLSKNPIDTLIVTSIQKMSRIRYEKGINESDIEKINKKRIVFIVDECHRSQFGDMHQAIRDTFPRAVFFGFTGTPIFEENKKKNSETTDIFGNELHRYTIADGIRDKNVLGFDVNQVKTFKDSDVRKNVALHECKCHSEAEAISNPITAKKYYEFMDKPMAGTKDSNGLYTKGIEDYLPKTQYQTDKHREMVVDDILNVYPRLSRNGKFSAIFATSSIKEAITYYKLFKSKKTGLKFAILVDPSIDNNDGFDFKEDGLAEAFKDYNEMFEQRFSFANSALYKKDISLRMAHKKPYTQIGKDQIINILIVVDQMLTGFDSKWINTLYLDKVLKNESLIQAFSRTNRLFGPDEKPFGIIRYYRFPNTMKRNIEDAVKMYSGDRVIGLFVPKLEENVREMNYHFEKIKQLFKNNGLNDFSKLPDDPKEKKLFVKEYNEFSKYLTAAKIQGYNVKSYSDDSNNDTINKEKTEENINDENQNVEKIDRNINENVINYNENSNFVLDSEKVAEDSDDSYNVTSSDSVIKISQNDLDALKQRYKEVGAETKKESNGNGIAYDIKGYLSEGDSVKINHDYMNGKFQKYLKNLSQENITEDELNQSLEELHKTFETLTQEQQKYANIFLHELQSGNIEIEESKTFMDYITEMQTKFERDQISRISEALGIDEEKLRNIMNSNVNEANLNDYGRFDELLKSIDIDKTRKYFEHKYNRAYSNFELNQDSYDMIRDFILKGGFEV